MSVFMLSIILNAKSCPNSAPTNVDYNWNTDAKKFYRGKNTYKTRKKQEREKKERERRVGDNRNKERLEG